MPGMPRQRRDRPAGDQPNMYACGGRGRIDPAARTPEPKAPAPEPEAERESYSYGAGTRMAVEVVSRTYDAQGRLLSETCIGEEMRTYVLSTGPGADDDPSDAEPEAEDSAD